LLAVLLFAIGETPFANGQTAQSAPQATTTASYNAESFVHELERLKADLEPASKSTESLRAYRGTLPKTWSVDAGNRHYDVPTSSLSSRLTKAERQPEVRQREIGQAREFLDALTAETASLSGPTTPSSDSARTKLDAILSRSEFAGTRQQSWWDKLRNRINEIISNALYRILSRVGGQKSLGYALLWIAVCAAAISIAYWTFRRWFRTAKMAEMALQAAAVPARSWQEWIFSAREASQRGDYRGAVHCAYWAGIARLQELGALAPDRAKTPREYLGALTKSRILQPETYVVRKQALSSLTYRFEKIWYGFHDATEADFRDSLAQLENLGCRLP
jgi:hypothetical protein